MKKLFCKLFITFTCCLFIYNLASATNLAKVKIKITDPMPFHVYAVGQPIELSLLATSSLEIPSLRYRWVDHKGQPISDEIAIKLKETIKLSSPHFPAGYYGLQIIADKSVAIEDRAPGEAMEYGFSIQANKGLKKPRLGSTDQFGMVHVKLEDPYMPSWVKTITWKTAGSNWWAHKIEQRRKLGLYELPLIVRGEWETDDREPISTQQLSRLGEKIKSYFSADPTVLYWELGLEENLKRRYSQPHYWDNLAAKARRVREMADQVNPEIKLIYQVTSIKLKASRNFLESDAVNYFDILSIHPYAWPNFPMPEHWLPEGLEKIQADMKERKLDLDIWFTEVGAPHHGNHPEGFFGYPGNGKEVDGLSRADSVSYLIQLHAIALSSGVEKIFWYNYIDRGHDREHAEQHFGLVDHLKFPKPVYTAYNNLHTLLQGKKAVRTKQTSLESLGMLVYSFEGENETVDVVWSQSGKERELDIAVLSDKPFQIVNAVGASVYTDGISENPILKIGNEPIFIVHSKVYSKEKM